MKALIQGVLCLTLALASWSGLGATKPLFDNDEIINVVLTAPIQQAYRQKKQSHRLWLNGQWAYTDELKQKVRHDVAIRTRGISRRKNCSQPPLELNFKKKQLKNTLFEGQDKIKLVSPCKKNSDSQQELILEYLAYKSLEILTDKSLKTRLLRLTYIDSNKKRKPRTQIAFLLEPEDQAAKRLELNVLHVPKINSSQLDKNHTALVELFQLMIANNDYSTIRGPKGKNCCHNMELLTQENSADIVFPIPYDFDSTGLVNPEYAVPPEKLPIDDVRTRYFRGRCKDSSYWYKNIEYILSKKQDIVDVFNASTELTPRNKSKTVSYLEKYFRLLENPKRVEKEIIGRCLGKKKLEYK